VEDQLLYDGVIDEHEYHKLFEHYAKEDQARAAADANTCTVPEEWAKASETTLARWAGIEKVTAACTIDRWVLATIE
jgi:hypothetical protein